MTGNTFRRQLLSGVLAIFITAAWLTFADRLISHLTRDHGEEDLEWIHVFILSGGQAFAAITAAVSVFSIWAIAYYCSSMLRGRVGRPLVTGLLSGLPAAACFYWMGAQLASGAWIAKQSYAFVIPYALAFCGAAAIAILVWVVLRLGESNRVSQRWQWALTAVLLMCSLAVSVANVVLFFSLYSRFHVLLYAMSALLAFLACHRVCGIAAERLPARAFIVVSLLGVLPVAISARAWVRMDRTARSEIICKAVTATDATRSFIAVASSSKPQRSLLYEALEVIRPGLGDARSSSPLPRGLKTLPRDWNVIFLVLDAARADTYPPVRIEGQQHARVKDTPFMNEWLRTAYRFRYAYSQAASTLRSMPPLFRSLESYERPEKNGMPFADYAKGLGRKPVAVVPSMFQEPTPALFPAMLEGFEAIDFFKTSEQSAVVPKSLKLIESVKSEPFFGWLHFYCLHSPGFADGKVLRKKDGGRTTRYRKTLRWLDKELEKLFEGLEGMGIMDRTLVIVAADHGGNLGDNRSKSHGSTVWEEIVRVPLAFRFPDSKGGLIEDAVVGNIDIVPTIAELLGAPKEAWHRGQSLVPLMFGSGVKWRREYYFRARHGSIVGLADGRQKIIHDVKGDGIYRYDLRTDPKEDRNLFSLTNPLDQQLLIKLMRHSPDRFNRYLKDTATQKLLAQKLGQVNEHTATEDLDFLLKLAKLDPSKQSHQAVQRIFGKLEDSAKRLLVVQHMFATDRTYWSKEIEEALRRIASTEQEIEFVGRLAAQGQPEFSEKFVAARMQWWADHRGADSWEPWLYLIQGWRRKSALHFAPALITMMEKAAEPGEEAISSASMEHRVLELVLDAAAGVRFKRNKKRASLKKRLHNMVGQFLEHHDMFVRAAAFNSLGNLGDGESAKTLRALLSKEGEPFQVRQAALRALYRLEGKRSYPLITELGKDPLLTYDVVEIFRKNKHKEGLPFLRHTVKNHFSWRVREVAKATIKKIEGS